MKNEIPQIINPMGRCWTQPYIDDIELDDTHAMMELETLKLLNDYSRSQPTGVYAGKMWRCFNEFDGEWLLRWWSDIPDNMCKCNQRIILVIE